MGSESRKEASFSKSCFQKAESEKEAIEKICNRALSCSTKEAGLSGLFACFIGEVRLRGVRASTSIVLNRTVFTKCIKYHLSHSTFRFGKRPVCFLSSYFLGPDQVSCQNNSQ